MVSLQKNDIGITLLAWVVMIAFDFFLHGGVLARLYLEDSPFLLSAETAFMRIPLGYLSFLLLGVLLVWLMKNIGINERRRGFLFGLQLGGLAWGALVLGLYSITTANLLLLIGWWIGQSLELAIAGYTVGTYREGVEIKKITWRVLLFFFIMIIITIIMQSIGLAPPMKTIN